jgi:hypothetical protein
VALAFIAVGKEHGKRKENRGQIKVYHKALLHFQRCTVVITLPDEASEAFLIGFCFFFL